MFVFKMKQHARGGGVISIKMEIFALFIIWFGFSN